MQTIILPAEQKPYIAVGELTGREYVAYRSKTAEGNAIQYCVLVKFKRENHKKVLAERYSPEPELGTRFGFSPLGIDGAARFVSSSWHESISLAAKSREVKVFQSQAELIRAMHNNEF